MLDRQHVANWQTVTGRYNSSRTVTSLATRYGSSILDNPRRSRTITNIRQKNVNVNVICLLPEPPRSSQELVQKCDRIGIHRCWFLRRGENRSTRRKTSRGRVENQQQTQSTYDAGSGNRTGKEASAFGTAPSRLPWRRYFDEEYPICQFAPC